MFPAIANCKSTPPFILWLSECRGIFRLNRRIAVRDHLATKSPGFLSICGLLALALLLKLASRQHDAYPAPHKETRSWGILVIIKIGK